MVHVLFVCLGNICRSPMAEGVFQHLVNAAGLSDQITVDSAGTGGWHTGENPHKGTLAIFKKYNIEYHGRARQLSRADFGNFDYILAMDEDNLAEIRSRQPSGTQPTVKLFLDYAKGIKDREVPDPYYDGRFELVYELVSNAAQGLLETLRQELNL